MRLHHVALALALVVSGGLAGCVGSGADDPIEGSQVDNGNGGGGAYPAPVARSPLDVDVEVSDVWVRPGDTVTLTASSGSATSFTWFLTDAQANNGDGHDHGGHDHGGHDHDHGDGMLDTGDMGAGTSVVFTLDEEGLYSFHCHPHPWMTMDILVTSDAEDTGTAHVAMVDDEHGDRFAPDFLRIRPGTEIIVWNNDTITHTLTQDDFWKKIDVTGDVSDYTPSTQGDYDVVVLAEDGDGGWGTARTRLLVDSGKPNEFATEGPIEGEITLALPADLPDELVGALPDQIPIGQANRHNFRSDYDVAEMRISFSSSAEVGGSITVGIGQQSREIIATASGESGELVLTDLDAGTYTLYVSGDGEGAFIDYVINVEIDRNLMPPPAGGGGHHH